MRDTVLFCDGWEFSLCPLGAEYSESLVWEPVDIPHDWLISDTLDLYKNSTGWYRRRLTLPADGRRTSLRFEGVYMDCRVYVNGVQAGEWKYGYTTFELDITDLLREGENMITVRVDHQSPNSRWYSGAGIYRRVWLNRFEDVRILPDGVYVTADIDGRVTVVTEAARPEGVSVDAMTVKTIITRAGSDEVLAEAVSSADAADVSVMAPETVSPGLKYSVNTQMLSISSPALWDISDPQLYKAAVSLYKDGVLTDERSAVFGFRSVEFTADRGFFLNGRPLKLHGACMHHDLGALGSAVNRSAIRRQLLKLREMGVNAIRTSHNPPAVEFLELTDELGFLVLDEGFDMWERPKTEFDYARFFRTWVRRDVASWIRRDRCHPSVFAWSIGNEIYDTHADERGQELTAMLQRLVRGHDPVSGRYITIGSNYMGSKNARKCADILKIAGYNYAERLYDEQHGRHPDWCIYGSETSSVVSSRGIYHFPASKEILCEDDEQCSALGNSSPVWASRSLTANITADRDREYCAGQFIWTGFDYIGEPTPYSTKNSYFGQIDTAGFPKDGAFVYRSAWTDHKTAPFVHIFPHWDFSEGTVVDIRVASNAPRVELYFNGELIAQGDFDRSCCPGLTLDATLPYTKGELVAVAYDADGREIARDTRRSFGNAAELRLSPDRTEIPAGSDELIFIDISAYDRDGEFAANANDRVFVNVTGAGRLVGLDNGDSTDYEQYKGTSRRLFSGKLLAIVAPTEQSGDICVRVSSPSLPEAELKLSALPAEPVKGITFIARNTDRAAECPDDKHDIPVRKIDLSGERTAFDREHDTLTFSVRVLPENASYAGEIEYRITTFDGIVSPLAQVVSHDSESVTVRCLGDGEFCLRALCKNGTGRYHIISMLSLTADGLGSALIDPYEFVTGGLYTVSNNASNGIDHGAAFGIGGGWFGYENLDFGPVGSDTVTLPIFANYATPVNFSVYDGTPDDGELIGEFEYHLPVKWMVYQPKTYKLSKTLRGVHTVSFKSELRYDVKGFSFERREKETAELPAASALSIYGDSFTKGEEAVTHIGNNVTLSFGTFDFGENSPKRVIITGRSQLEKNSINLEVKGDVDKRFLLEFEGCGEYTERSFDISGIRGRVDVSFFFLPGCDFDMKGFRFEN